MDEETKPNSIIFSRTRRETEGTYYVHIYEVSLSQIGSDFQAKMTSAIRYRHSDYVYQPNWSYEKTYTTLEKARKRYDEILAEPRKYGAKNLPTSVQYYWGQAESTKSKILLTYDRPADLANGKLAQSIALGTTKMPSDNLVAGEVARQLWGRTEKAAQAALLEFVQTAPLVYGYWTHWKWLYKQAEAANDALLLPTFISRLDTVGLASSYKPALFWQDQKPSALTFGYMKRRNRRYLRKFAKEDGAAYVRFATEILLKTSNDKIALNLHDQWVSFDIMFGNSGRYVQKNHSRGAYVLAGGKRLSLRTQDERIPEAWDNYTDGLLHIYRTPNIAWQTLEWTLKMLLKRKVELPRLSNASYLTFLRSDSPLLIRAATTAINERLASQEQINPELAALAFYKSNGTIRKQMIEQLNQAQSLSNWQQNFVSELVKILAQLTPGSKLTARQYDLALLLTTKYARNLANENLVLLVPALLASRKNDFTELVRSILQKMVLTSIRSLLQSVLASSDVVRQKLSDLLVETFQNTVLEMWTIQAILLDTNPYISQVGWRLLAANKQPTTDIINGIWSNLLSYPYYRASLIMALNIPEAFALLLKTPDGIKNLQTMLGKEPALMSQIASVAVITTLIKSSPLNFVLSLVSLMDETAWLQLRDMLLGELRADARLAQFWQIAWKAIPTEASGQLSNRLLNDPIMQQSFMEIADAEFLETSDPLFENFLLSWIESKADMFGLGSPILLRATMSKLMSIRNWALGQVHQVGMTLPFALRMLESGLPETIAKGKDFFEALEMGAANELDYALAICDSPDKSVQFYGREYVQKRWNSLPVADLLARLAEHPDVPIQEVVASKLLEPNAVSIETKEFDRGVLRSRNKGRRVKELVKQRLQGASQLDTQTLLELARSRTPRDAEWALQELTRLAMAGEKIEGFTIEGVNGI